MKSCHGSSELIFVVLTSLLTSVSTEGGTDRASEGSIPASSMGRK